MNLSDIKIRDDFLRSKPKKEKMDVCREHYKTYGKLDRDIVINKQGYLIDGYIGYLVLVENLVQEYDVITSGTSYQGSVTTYVYAQHKNNPKEYVWRVPKTKSFENEIQIGDKVLVATQQGKKAVIVTRIERLNKPPVSARIKRVLRILNEDAI